MREHLKTFAGIKSAVRSVAMLIFSPLQRLSKNDKFLLSSNNHEIAELLIFGSQRSINFEGHICFPKAARHD